MADRRYPAEQVADTSPPQTQGPGYLAMPLNQGGMVLMDVPCPFSGVPVGPVTQVRKQAEFQMIMCVNQSRKQKEPGQIKGAFRKQTGPVIRRPALDEMDR